MNPFKEIATLRDVTEGELRNTCKVGNAMSIYDVIRAVTGCDTKHLEKIDRAASSTSIKLLPV